MGIWRALRLFKQERTEGLATTVQGGEDRCENVDAVKSEMMARERQWLETLAYQQNDVDKK